MTIQKARNKKIDAELQRNLIRRYELHFYIDILKKKLQCCYREREYLVISEIIFSCSCIYIWLLTQQLGLFVMFSLFLYLVFFFNCVLIKGKGCIKSTINFSNTFKIKWTIDT